MADEQLTVRMGLNRDAFTDGLNKAQSSVSKLGALFSKVLAGGAIGAAIGTVVSSLKQWAIEARAVRATTENAGVSIAFYESISKSLRKIGEEASTLNPALQKMADTLNSARLGDAGALKLFDKLNLRDRIFEFEDTEAALFAIRDEFDRLGPSAERTGLAVDIAGKKASQFVFALSQLPERISEFEKFTQLVRNIGVSKGPGNLFGDLGKDAQAAFSGLFRALSEFKTPDMVMDEDVKQAAEITKEMKEANALAVFRAEMQAHLNAEVAKKAKIDMDNATVLKAELEATEQLETMREKSLRLSGELEKLEEKRTDSAEAEAKFRKASTELQILNKKLAEDEADANERSANALDSANKSRDAALQRLNQSQPGFQPVEVDPARQGKVDFLRDIAPDVDIGQLTTEAERLEEAGGRATNLGQFNTGQTLRDKAKRIRDGLGALGGDADGKTDALLDKNVEAVRELLDIIKKGRIIATPQMGGNAKK